MELSKLYKAFKELVGGEDIPKAVEMLMLSPDKDAVLSAYVELVGGDLATDNLQKIFQYYFADRKEACQDFTPKSLAKLCSAVTSTEGGVVYDLCAGSGALTIQKWCQTPNKVFICEELDPRAASLLLFNMAVRNMNGYVLNRNAITLELKKVYKLSHGSRFSAIEEVQYAPDILADEIVANPPFNLKWDAPEPLLADDRFCGAPIPPASNANFAFVFTALSRMKVDGRCAFILPCGCLTSDAEKEIREYLLSEGMIYSVILLPPAMFEATSIATCIIVFSRGNKAVKLYDLRKRAMQEQRDQNAQYGGPSHERRVYHKVVNVIPDDVISEICTSCGDVPGFSREVAIEEIEKNNYIITPSIYILPDEANLAHRPYSDIMADINRVSRERSAIKITCNESLAKVMGLYEAAEVAAQADNAGLNNTFKLLGGHYESRRYIVLSKNKNEFKIENQDKEILSSLINFFLPMWKQHIFYLNREENRLLIELRDAMLPELMNGALNVSAFDSTKRDEI